MLGNTIRTLRQTSSIFFFFTMSRIANEPWCYFRQRVTPTPRHETCNWRSDRLTYLCQRLGDAEAASGGRQLHARSSFEKQQRPTRYISHTVGVYSKTSRTHGKPQGMNSCKFTIGATPLVPYCDNATHLLIIRTVKEFFLCCRDMNSAVRLPVPHDGWGLGSTLLTHTLSKVANTRLRARQIQSQFH